MLTTEGMSCIETTGHLSSLHAWVSYWYIQTDASVVNTGSVEVRLNLLHPKHTLLGVDTQPQPQHYLVKPEEGMH